MENYKKTKIVEKPCPLPFADLPPDIIEMKVKDGSKIRNLMGYAIGKMELDSVRQILFTGSGKAVSKTITCVEIMKRRLKELHQITKVLFKQIEEIWEPIVPEAGLDALTVKRNIPAICVLLSKDALDPQEPGYQFLFLTALFPLFLPFPPPLSGDPSWRCVRARPARGSSGAGGVA
uniref:Ribonuclease P/MRP subunit p25 like n=1 Tax=Anas zonorhyncha TaxID=75864 RepID=A0A8B9UBC8_9AVES